MPVNECIPYFEAAYTQKLTANFTAQVFGKRFVSPLAAKQSGPGLSATAEGGNFVVAGLPAAGGEVGGVAGWDVAAGGKGPVIRGAGTMLPVLSGAALASGAELMVDAAGKVITWVAAAANRKVGKAHSAAGAADVEVYVELYPIGAGGAV